MSRVRSDLWPSADVPAARRLFQALRRDSRTPPPGHHGADEIRAFLSHLAVQDRVSASTQNQALNALVFLYHRVLGKDAGFIRGVERAKRPKRLPVVLTREEVKAVLQRMIGTPQLVCRLLYTHVLNRGGRAVRSPADGL